LSTELARIELHGVGIYRLSSDPPELGTQALPRFTADIYCEHMALVAGANP
jgi:hypothetical protein